MMTTIKQTLRYVLLMSLLAPRAIDLYAVSPSNTSVPANTMRHTQDKRVTIEPLDTYLIIEDGKIILKVLAPGVYSFVYNGVSYKHTITASDFNTYYPLLDNNGYLKIELVLDTVNGQIVGTVLPPSKQDLELLSNKAIKAAAFGVVQKHFMSKRLTQDSISPVIGMQVTSCGISMASLADMLVYACDSFKFNKSQPKLSNAQSSDEYQQHLGIALYDKLLSQIGSGSLKLYEDETSTSKDYDIIMSDFIINSIVPHDFILLICNEIALHILSLTSQSVGTVSKLQEDLYKKFARINGDELDNAIKQHTNVNDGKGDLVMVIKNTDLKMQIKQRIFQAVILMLQNLDDNDEIKNLLQHCIDKIKVHSCTNMSELIQANTTVLPTDRGISLAKYLDDLAATTSSTTVPSLQLSVFNTNDFELLKKSLEIAAQELGLGSDLSKITLQRFMDVFLPSLVDNKGDWKQGHAQTTSTLENGELTISHELQFLISNEALDEILQCLANGNRLIPEAIYGLANKVQDFDLDTNGAMQFQDFDLDTSGAMQYDSSSYNVLMKDLNVSAKEEVIEKMRKASDSSNIEFVPITNRVQAREFLIACIYDRYGITPKHLGLLKDATALTKQASGGEVVVYQPVSLEDILSFDMAKITPAETSYAKLSGLDIGVDLSKSSSVTATELQVPLEQKIKGTYKIEPNNSVLINAKMSEAHQKLLSASLQGKQSGHFIMNGGAASTDSKFDVSVAELRRGVVPNYISVRKVLKDENDPNALEQYKVTVSEGDFIVLCEVGADNDQLIYKLYQVPTDTTIVLTATITKNDNNQEVVTITFNETFDMLLDLSDKTSPTVQYLTGTTSEQEAFPDFNAWMTQNYPGTVLDKLPDPIKQAFQTEYDSKKAEFVESSKPVTQAQFDVVKSSLKPDITLDQVNSDAELRALALRICKSIETARNEAASRASMETASQYDKHVSRWVESVMSELKKNPNHVSTEDEIITAVDNSNKKTTLDIERTAVIKLVKSEVARLAAERAVADMLAEKTAKAIEDADLAPAAEEAIKDKLNAWKKLMKESSSISFATLQAQTTKTVATIESEIAKLPDAQQISLKAQIMTDVHNTLFTYVTTNVEVNDIDESAKVAFVKELFAIPTKDIKDTNIMKLLVTHKLVNLNDVNSNNIAEKICTRLSIVMSNPETGEGSGETGGGNENGEGNENGGGSGTPTTGDIATLFAASLELYNSSVTAEQRTTPAIDAMLANLDKDNQQLLFDAFKNAAKEGVIALVKQLHDISEYTKPGKLAGPTSFRVTDIDGNTLFDIFIAPKAAA